MPPSPQPPVGGGPNRRRLDDPLDHADLGIPDEAVGPGEASPAESLSLASDPTAEALARKLAAEAASWEERRGRRRGDGEA